MEAANQIPPVTGAVSPPDSEQKPTLTEAERQALLLEKLDLSSLETWSPQMASKAQDLLAEYHDMRMRLVILKQLSIRLWSRILSLSPSGKDSDTSCLPKWRR